MQRHLCDRCEVELDFSYLHGDAFSPTRKVYSSDVCDDEWEFVAP
jgi:hypothetical protein